MGAIFTPRFWVFLWGATGAAFVLYVILAAAVHQEPKGAPSALNHDPALLVGEMADFTYAFPPRSTPKIPFQYEDQSISLDDFKGKAILVNFWATWCAPCLKELPSLDVLEGDLGGERFAVVAIAADPRGPETAGEYLDRLNIKNLKLYSDQRLLFSGAIGVRAVLPVSILYDAKGREVGRLLGEADWSSPEARRLVKSVING